MNRTPPQNRNRLRTVILASLVAVIASKSPTFAQNFEISVERAFPATPHSGASDSWCEIEFNIENDTGWLASQLHLGAEVATLNGKSRTVFLDLRGIDPGDSGTVSKELTIPCSDMVGLFTLLPERQHLGYRCGLTNHSVEACYERISFRDNRNDITESPSTSAAFETLAFGMTEQEVQNTYPALQQTNRAYLALPGQFDERFWTDREEVMGVPARQTLLFDRVTERYAGHVIAVPRIGVPISGTMVTNTCRLLQESQINSFGPASIERRYTEDFDVWMPAQGRVEYHPSLQGELLIGCRLYHFSPEVASYFATDRLAVDTIFDFRDVAGIYVALNDSRECSIETFDVDQNMIGLSDGFIEFRDATCDFRQTGRDSDGQAIRGIATCFSGNGQNDLSLEIRAVEGNVVMDFSGDAIQPLRRCWKR